MNNTKLRIAELISRSGDCNHSDNPTYEELTETIYDNIYRTIYKVPTDMFFYGIVGRFVIKDLEHANRILNLVKEVVKDVLEVSGFETSFQDSDWENLVFVENTERYGNKWKFQNNTKGYLYEFFEI